MKFSFSSVPADSIEDRPGFVALGEALGFDAVWIPDQTFYGDPYTVLGACASLTSRISLGIGVTNPFTRHPVITIRAAATLDCLSRGRVRLGLGAGNQRELIAPLGLSGSYAATAMLEFVEVAKCLLAGQRLSFAGRTMTVEGVQLEFRTRPELPVYLAGRGPSILRVAGRAADGVILSLAGFARAKAIAYAGLAQAGRQPNALRIVAWGECLATDMPGANVERSRVVLGHVLGRAPEAGLRVMGLDEATISNIKVAYAARGPEGAARWVTDELMRQQLVLGTAEECRDRIRQLEALGADEFACLIRAAPFEEQRRRLAWFAENIMAPLRADGPKSPNSRRRS